MKRISKVERETLRAIATDHDRRAFRFTWEAQKTAGLLPDLVAKANAHARAAKAIRRALRGR